MSIAARPEFDKFYLVSGAHAPDALHVSPCWSDPWQPFRGSWQKLAQLTTGALAPSEPLKFSHLSGSAPMDQITTSLVWVHLLSQRVIECLGDHGFSGWGTFPVTIQGSGGTSVENYSGLTISGCCAAIDNSLSIPASPVEGASGAGRAMMGLYFDLKTWDGSHIFTPNGGIVIVCAEVKRHWKELERLTFCSSGWRMWRIIAHPSRFNMSPKRAT